MSLSNKFRVLVKELNLFAQRLSDSFHNQGLPALCTALPEPHSHGPSSVQWPSLSDLLNNPVLNAVPFKRRTAEKRKTRKNVLPEMVHARPKKNIVICLECGTPHERETICGKCYEKVRQETKIMMPHVAHHPYREVKFFYQDDKLDSVPTFRGQQLVEIPRDRPSWFPQILMKNKQAPSGRGDSDKE